MKKNLLFILLLPFIAINAQVEVANGPNLDNDRDSKMNRMLGGDDNSFYCYRIRSKGKGTSYIVEKYNKTSLKPEFSKDILMKEDRLTKIEDIEYAENNVYVFSRDYDKQTQKMTLLYQSVSSTGAVSAMNELLVVNSDHYEFVDFEIYPNPGKTKFLIKVFYKADKEDSYKTDFILVGAKDMKKIWSKRVDSKVGSKAGGSMVFSFWGMTGSDNDIGFIGLYLDDEDNIYYASSYYAKNSTDKEKHYKASVSIIESKLQEPKTTELTFDDDYLVKDVEFAKTPSGEIVVGGFLKDVIERKGRDLVKVGIFSFTIKITDGTILAKTVKMFDDKILMALESSAKKSKYFKYKLDYILPVGKDVFYVGEQYQEQLVTTYNSQTHSSSSHWEYEYMDVIVAKLNAKGEFEWIKNTPLRNHLTLGGSSNGFGFAASSVPASHVFKQYIAVATANSIYIINNEHKKNIEIYAKPDFEPKDLKTMTGIHGSNFVCNTVALTDGAIKHDLIFNNEDYCFAPIQERNAQFYPPSDTEIFVKGNGNELYIYTEDKGLDRFTKLKLK